MFATGSVVASSVRGKDDLWNNAVGACAAGSVVGARFGSAQTAAIACPMFAFTSIMVDLSGKTFRPSREIMAVKHAEQSTCPPIKPRSSGLVATKSFVMC